MPQLRVFISHSARGDDDAFTLVNELRAGLEAVNNEDDGKPKFAVLIDKDDLKLGVLWRHTLNTWDWRLRRRDCAVDRKGSQIRLRSV
jgi:hypothetical protein